MNWSHELLASAIWLAQAFAISLLGFVVVIAVLAHYSVWGRQFWRLSGTYFNPLRNWRPLAVLSVILLLTLFGVRMNVLFSFWYNGFYSSLQKLDGRAIWFFLGVFSILASVHVARALLDYYVQQAFQIRWRIWLNDHLVERWLAKQAYYRGQYISQSHVTDNPDQRIQQDVASFISGSVTLSMGLLSSVVSLIAFTVILWGLSGTLVLFGIAIPRAMIWLVFLYVFVATLFAFWVGRPLIRLNFLNEQLNANYRYSLLRLREYREGVAFYRGEGVEKTNLDQHFGSVIGNVWSIVYRSLKFSGFNLVISQAAVVFPFLVQLPRFLSKQVTLGDMMQTADSFGQVQGALSFFREAYDNFASYRAALNRLIGFMDAIEEADNLPRPTVTSEGERVAVAALTVKKPNAEPLLTGLNLEISAVQPLLVRGSSGVGKTTLLRAIAGFWPYTDGAITRPQGERALFLAQKPYLPLGTLRKTLYYPGTPPADGNSEREAEVLSVCRLGHLIKHLDQEADWANILSLGEQQRLAFGRVLLNQPDVVFLDEATSAMDEEQEAIMYRTMLEWLPDSVVVSIGHRSTLKPFHRFELTLKGAGGWELQPLGAGVRV
jgi:putative ATP-binding cassette transporter